MPSTTKTLYFISSALVSSISVGLLGYGMSAHWATTTMDCTSSGTEFTNGTAVVTYDLFDGFMSRDACPYFGASDPFKVFPKLIETGTVPLVLHALVVILLCLCLLCSAGSILISLYNSVSNPYETYMGPIGVYTCSSISTCLSVLVLIIYVLNINITGMAEDLVEHYAGDNSVDLKNKFTEMKIGYYMVIPYTLLSLLAITLIFMYDRAAYTQRKEQQRPTEDAPKEIMMY